MAHRLLLTLLAVLTGLSAQLAPTQARASAVPAAVVAVLSPAMARTPAALVDLAQLPEPGRRHARMVASVQDGRALAIVSTVGVRIGIDRAHR